jgi:hypothetical protein
MLTQIAPTCNTPRTPHYTEAPCSMNTFLEVAGIGRVQITGRGCTPAEAAANLRGQVEALLPTPPPVQTREERLAQLLACGLSKASQKGDWNLIEKLSKAAALVLADAVQPGEREGLMTVRSRSNPLTHYEVEQEACSCKDYTCRAKEGTPYYCMHLLSVMMVQRLA